MLLSRNLVLEEKDIFQMLYDFVEKQGIASRGDVCSFDIIKTGGSDGDRKITNIQVVLQTQKVEPK